METKPLRLISLGLFPLRQNLASASNHYTANSMRIQQYDDKMGRRVTSFADWGLIRQCFNPCTTSPLLVSAPCTRCPESNVRLCHCEHKAQQHPDSNTSPPLQCAQCKKLLTLVFESDASDVFPYCIGACEKCGVYPPSSYSVCGGCDACVAEAENPATAIIECDTDDKPSLRACAEQIAFLRYLMVHVHVVVIVATLSRAHLIETYFSDNKRFPRVRISCMSNPRAIDVVKHADMDARHRVILSGQANDEIKVDIRADMDTIIRDVRDKASVFVPFDQICPDMERGRARRALIRTDIVGELKYSPHPEGCYMSMKHFLDAHSRQMSHTPFIPVHPYVGYLTQTTL